MRNAENIGFILLGIVLIIIGLQNLVGLNFPYVSIVQGILAVAAGILILLGR